VASDVEKYLTEWVTTEVLGGFTKQKELFADIEERAADEGVDEAVARLKKHARDLFAKRKVEEKKWKGPTTNDRIDAAFAALNDAGIVAMQNAGYTMSEGWEDCNQEADDRNDEGERPRGATFYHGQDLERGVVGDGLMLAYGAYEDDDKKHDAASIAIAREVVQTLTKYGVKTKWNGKVETRIEIRPFEWKRRQFTKSPKLAPSSK
jgi:hypothetical protein